MRELDDPWDAPTSHTHAMFGIPPDAQTMGLDRNSEEGAMLALAGSLRPAKASHRVVAWIVLVTFAAPFLLSTLRAIF